MKWLTQRRKGAKGFCRESLPLRLRAFACVSKSMFQFVVRRLRWLARVPLAPQIFDALLLTWTAIFHREKLRAIEALEAAALRLPGISLATHRFGGLGFACGGREFAHVHGNGLLDVKLTRERATELTAAGRAEPHHVFGPSAWISFHIRTPADCEPALALIEEAAAFSLGSARAGSHTRAFTKPQEAT